MTKAMTPEDLLPHDDFYSRRLIMPDETVCFVHMKGWYWNAMDYLGSVGDWNSEIFVRVAWQAAKMGENDGVMDHDTFHDEFAALLGRAILLRNQKFTHQKNGTANDT